MDPSCDKICWNSSAIVETTTWMFFRLREDEQPGAIGPFSKGASTELLIKLESTLLNSLELIFAKSVAVMSIRIDIDMKLISILHSFHWSRHQWWGLTIRYWQTFVRRRGWCFWMRFLASSQKVIPNIVDSLNRVSQESCVFFLAHF